MSDSPSSRNSDATLIYGALDSGRPVPLAEPTAPSLLPPLIAQPTQRHHASPGPENPGTSDRPVTNRLLVGGVLAIAVLLLVSVGIGAAFLFRQSPTDQPSGANVGNVNPPGSTSPSSIQAGTSTTDPLVSSAIESQPAAPGSRPLQIKATASSVRYSVQSNTYDPSNAVDGKKRTAWVEGVDGPGRGEWIKFDFDRQINLHRVLILPGYFKSPAIWARNNRISGATLHFSDGTSRLFNFPDRMERHLLDLGSIRTRWVRIELKDVYLGQDPDTPISEVAFEWEP